MIHWDQPKIEFGRKVCAKRNWEWEHWRQTHPLRSLQEQKSKLPVQWLETFWISFTATLYIRLDEFWFGNKYTGARLLFLSSLHTLEDEMEK